MGGEGRRESKDREGGRDIYTERERRGIEID